MKRVLLLPLLPLLGSFAPATTESGIAVDPLPPRARELILTPPPAPPARSLDDVLRDVLHQ